MSALSQFEGARIERITLAREDDLPSAVGMSLRLKDGSDRTLEVYTVVGTDDVLHVRIDGLYVPPDDL